MLQELVDAIQRLNLSYPQNFVGAHFQEILSLLSIIFGGSFLLFAWKQRGYFLGVIGLLIGGWLGLILKGHLSPQGTVAPFLYLALCAVAGAYIAITLQRLIGMLMGGFTVATLIMVLMPDMLEPEKGNLLTLCMAFLLGGGLGAIFPKFFFVFNSSLIGAVFVTYGVSQSMLAAISQGASPDMRTFLHLVVFLPLFLFGIIFQMTNRDEEKVIQVVQAQPVRG